MKKILKKVIFLCKGILLILIVFVVARSLYSPKNVEKNFEKIWNQIVNEIDVSDMEQKENQDIKRFLSLNPNSYVKIRYYKSSDPMSANEIVLAKFKNNDDSAIFKNNLEKHLEGQINLFGGYAPLEEQKLKNSVIHIYANYGIFIVHEEAEDIYAQFKNTVGE